MNTLKTLKNQRKLINPPEVSILISAQAESKPMKNPPQAYISNRTSRAIDQDFQGFMSNHQKLNRYTPKHMS